MLRIDPIVLNKSKASVILYNNLLRVPPLNRLKAHHYTNKINVINYNAWKKLYNWSRVYLHSCLLKLIFSKCFVTS